MGDHLRTKGIKPPMTEAMRAFISAGYDLLEAWDEDQVDHAVYSAIFKESFDDCLWRMGSMLGHRPTRLNLSVIETPKRKDSAEHSVTAASVHLESGQTWIRPHAPASTWNWLRVVIVWEGEDNAMYADVRVHEESPIETIQCWALAGLLLTGRWELA